MPAPRCPAPSRSRWAAATTQTIVIGSAPAAPAADTFYTGSASGYNTLQGLADAINAAAAGTSLSYSGTAGHRFGSFQRHADLDHRRQSSAIRFHLHPGGQRHSGEFRDWRRAEQPEVPPNTIYTGDGVNTLSALADAINIGRDRGCGHRHHAVRRRIDPFTHVSDTLERTGR